MAMEPRTAASVGRCRSSASPGARCFDFRHSGSCSSIAGENRRARALQPKQTAHAGPMLTMRRTLHDPYRYERHRQPVRKRPDLNTAMPATCCAAPADRSGRDRNGILRDAAAEHTSAPGCTTKSRGGDAFTRGNSRRLPTRHRRREALPQPRQCPQRQEDSRCAASVVQRVGRQLLVSRRSASAERRPSKTVDQRRQRAARRMFLIEQEG